MFGSSNLFGQSAGAPFGSQSPFGPNNVTNSPFAPKPFGLQTGGSMFGSTSTGVFGQSSSSLSSTPAFGSVSSTGFGNSTPAFGNSSSPFGGSSAFGGFGSNAQSSPFGNSVQQSQPAFGSTPSFGASSQPSFGGSSTSVFGSSTTPSFGSTGTPGFGNTSTPTFGSTPTNTFGNTGTGFGVSSTPAFGSGGAFGSTSTSVFGNASAFGATSSPAFGATTTPAFGASSNTGFGSAPAFGAASTPSFGTSSSNFGSTPSFGQSTSAFGATPSPFGAQSSSFGSQATTPTFGGGGFGQSTSSGQRGGSRVASYATTPEADGGSSTQAAGKLLSLSAMPVYKDKSHEELRWEDYQQGDKGGPNPAVQSNAGMNFGVSATQSNPVSSSTFGQSSANPFSASVQSNPFASKPQGFGTTGFGTSSAPTFGSSPFGGTSTPSPFGSTPTPSPFGGTSTPASFGSTAAQTSSVFASSTPGFGSNTSPSPFGASSSSGIASTSLFGSTPNQGAPTSFGSTSAFGNTQSSPLLQSSAPSFGQTGAALVQNSSSFGQMGGFGQPSISSAPSTGFGANLFSSTPSLSTSNQFGNAQSTPSLSTPSQPTLPTQTSNAFNFGGFSQTQSAGAGGFGNGSSIFGQSLGQSSANQSSAVAQPVGQPVAVTNPFGTLPVVPQMSIGNTGTSPSIQYGISSMPVVDKPSPVRISSLLTSRHLSQRRIRLPARKYHPKTDGSRVPFFSDNEESNTTRGDALFIPRQNPRALVIQPTDRWPTKSPPKDTYVMVHENGKTTKEHDHTSNGSVTAGHDNIGTENGSAKEHIHHTKINQNPGSVYAETLKQNGDSNMKFSGHRAGGTTLIYEHGADIEAIMPKLKHSDYYTEPEIRDLSAKERAQPGFSRNVKDFIVGRHGYGSIKFMGETDVRCLDLDSLVQFNNREVIVYTDESKKPPVGRGLNKPAEVTLLNIKCYEKNTGKQMVEGPKIEKYKEMLRKKAEEQGAEFLSYDPARGEWKFRVNHFSKYVFHDEDGWEIDVAALCL